MKRTGQSGFTLVELLMTISVLGIIATASGALFTMSIEAQSKGSSRAELQREGMVAMERMTNGLRRATHLMIPNHHSKSRRILAFSGLINDDGDYYFNDPLFPKYDEDFASDMDEDGANGMVAYDDDGDGRIDERAGWAYLSKDEFNAAGFKGNDGDWPWRGPWSELLEGDGAAKGVVQVTTVPGMDSYAVSIGGDGVSITGSLIQRQVDTLGADAAMLSFRYSQAGASGGTVTLAVQDALGVWNDLETYAVGGARESTVQAFDILDHAAARTQIRLVGSGKTGAGGFIYFDDFQVRTIYNGGGSWTADDDEDGASDEDPIDGLDNDLDGNIDEDPGAESNADGRPGIAGIDDDGDGLVDEGDPDDDDEDGSFAEAGALEYLYDLDDATQTLQEHDRQYWRIVDIASHVTRFQVDYESPSRVTIYLDLTGDDGYVLQFKETVCLRNVAQNAGKRVR